MNNKSERRFQVFAHIIMAFFAFLAIVPIALMVISSFMDNSTLVAEGYTFFPKKLSLDAYAYLIEQGAQIGRAYFISIALTTIGVICSLTMTTLMAYPLSRRDLPYKGALNFIVFFTMLFNGGLVPTYLIYTGVFNIKNTFASLLIPGLLMSAYNVMLMKSYFVTGIPVEMLEAADIDGATELQKFIKLVIPLSKPIIATIGLFVGIAYWNDWNNGYIYLTTRTDLYSIQNLLNRMITNIRFLTEQSGTLSQAPQGLAAIPTATVQMAIAVIGILPIIIIYPFVQRYFVKGITLGGVKG